MKKKIIGITLAAFLFGGAAGLAASGTSLIGSQVEGLFEVYSASGNRIDDAVIIMGKAYAPVRAISDVTGAKLSVTGKTITITSIAKSFPEVPAPTATAEPVIILTQEEIDIIKQRITTMERGIEAAQKSIALMQKKLAASTDEAEIQDLKKSIFLTEGIIKAGQERLEEDKARLAAAGE
ncbi:hypothetical protein [Paenibacillus typhae]|uniref:hypothetical protein n=1 Tax=Paenibacillus typhae TaxID=1174501 RepID=UPI001C8DD07D|nr:hypothetical protein [Paenibacillus typhae]MBY0011732.1 hypothetical protein [Paenibacillus typhae]